MDTEGKLIRLNNRFPELYQVLRELANEEKGGADPARGEAQPGGFSRRENVRGYTWSRA